MDNLKIVLIVRHNQKHLVGEQNFTGRSIDRRQKEKYKQVDLAANCVNRTITNLDSATLQCWLNHQQVVDLLMLAIRAAKEFRLLSFW